MLTHWRPERELKRWSRDFDDFLGSFVPRTRPLSHQPAVDIEEAEDHFLLHADLPGLSEKDIDIKVDGDTLSISGSREQRSDKEDHGRRMSERYFGRFERHFILGPEISSDTIEAAYQNGVLTLKLPKSERAKPRQIPVGVH